LKATIRILVVFLALTSAAVSAGIPPLINLQGRLTDTNGNNISDGVHTVVFRIYADSIGLIAPLWAETLPVQVSGGLFSAIIGRTSPFPAGLYLGSPNRFLGLAVDSEPEMPRVRLNSVAYAYQSENADVAVVALDLSCVGCIDATHIAVAAVGADEIASNAVNPSEIATDAVGASEIEANAVGSSEIAADAVGSSEIATGAVRSAEVLDGSLTAVDLDDEPGVASNSQQVSTGTDLDDTWKTLVARTITTPGPGYVLAIGSIDAVSHHTIGESDLATFGVSTSSNEIPISLQLAIGDVDADQSSSPYFCSGTGHGLFSTAGGSDVFYLIGKEWSGDVVVTGRQLSLIYFPTAYGTVTEPDSAASAMQEFPSAEPDATLNSSSQATVSVQSRQIAELQDRLKQLEDRLEQMQSLPEE
jgi:hypothetical protein